MIAKIQNTCKSLTKSEFFRNSFALISGTSCALLIHVLSSPILTRLYSPTEFGIFALFFSIVTFLSVIFTAKYELTIILPKSECDAVALVIISVAISVILGLIALCVVAVCCWTRAFSNCGWLYFIPLVCLFMGFFQSGYYLLVRQKRFYAVAVAKLLQAIGIVVSSILFSFVVDGYWGLIFGYVTGQVVSGLLVLIMISRTIKSYWQHIKLTEFYMLIKRYKNFPLYLTFSGLVENFAAQLPTFFLTAFFGEAVVGLYALANRVTRVPTIVISAAISDVFRQKASSEYAKKGECSSTFSKVFLLLMILSGTPFIVLFVIAPELFTLVFGPEWTIAGEYARILTVMLFLQFIINPLSGMFIIAEKQKINFIMQIYLIFGNALSLWCGYYFFHSVKISLVLFTIVYSIKYLFELAMSYRFSLGEKPA